MTIAGADATTTIDDGQLRTRIAIESAIAIAIGATAIAIARAAAVSRTPRLRAEAWEEACLIWRLAVWLLPVWV